MSTLTSSRRPRTVMLFLFTAWFSPLFQIPAVAQEYGEQMDVRVIQVPVTVWRGANPVTGLTREDFELYVNGERHEVSYFDTLEYEEMEDGRTEPTYPIDRRRLTLLLFDLASSSPIQLIRTQSAVEDLINGASPDDYFGVAVYRGNEVQYLAPFTSDRSAVVRAVATLEGSRSKDPLALTITPEERVAHAVAVGSLPPSVAAVEGGFSDDLITGMDDFDSAIEAMSGLNVPSVREAVERDQQLMEQGGANSWAAALSSVADHLAPLEGIRQVALFSAGASISGPFPEVMDDLKWSYRRAGVTLHIIDIAGLRAPGGDAIDSRKASTILGTTAPASSPQVPDILFQAAAVTGGHVIHNTGVSNALRLFSETRSITYVLGFRPPASERRENDIVVKLKGGRWFTNISYRGGYTTRDRTRKGVSELLLADAMINEVSFEDVTMQIYTDARGIVDVGVPSDELLSHAVAGRVNVDVYLYVFDAGGNVVRWKHRRMRLDEQKARTILAGRELVRRERFDDLPPGRYSARALVHVRERDLLSSRRKDFEITAR